MPSARPGFKPLLATDLADELKRKLLPQRVFESGRTIAIENVRCTQQTPKAIFCRINALNVWIPRSQLHSASEVKQVGDEGTLAITRWFAQKRQLI